MVVWLYAVTRSRHEGRHSHASSQLWLSQFVYYKIRRRHAFASKKYINLLNVVDTVEYESTDNEVCSLVFIHWFLFYIREIFRLWSSWTVFAVDNKLESRRSSNPKITNSSRKCNTRLKFVYIHLRHEHVSSHARWISSLLTLWEAERRKCQSYFSRFSEGWREVSIVYYFITIKL